MLRMSKDYTRRVKQFAHELGWYQWDIVGLVKVRWPGFKNTAIDKGH